MKTTEYIALRIDRLPKGYVFTYDDFITEVDTKVNDKITKVMNKETIIKALNRMVASGKICKLAKGKYYKPETTVFGNLQPNQAQVVKDMLDNDGKPVGYLTGYSIYNQLGLTTQVSNAIQIGKNAIRPPFKREQYFINFIKQKNIITKENIPLLQILDAIRYIKKIPDTTVVLSCKRLMAILKGLTEGNITTLVRLALKYPPATRALLGALLDANGNTQLTKPLQISLNPISTYNFTGVNKILETAIKYNIK